MWTLFLRIKLLELELRCHIQVIHVPGTTMIVQGTDGLSRGVNMQNLASHPSNGLIPLLWRAAPSNPNVLRWALPNLPPILSTFSSWTYQTDFSNWSKSCMISQPVLWCLSPSFARQGFLQALESWVESPTDSCHIFIVPRILQRDFGRLSKFVTFGGQYSNLPLSFVPLVPFVLYFILPFDRHSIYNSQTISSVDTASNPIPFWIQKELDGLLRVSAPS